MSGVEIDNSNSRIWLLRYPEAFRVGDFEELFAKVRSMNPEGIMHAVLVDFSATDPWSVNAEIRREASEVLKANMDFLTKYTVAEARVTPNKLARGMLTVFDWVNPLPWKVNNCASGPTAELWLRSQLERAGFEVPSKKAWFDNDLSRTA